MIRIGVDGGGTTTRAVIIDENTRVLGRGEAGTSNHYGVGLDAAVQNIAQAVESALEEAQIAPADVAFFGLGLAGACSDAEQKAIADALQTVQAKLCPNARLVVDEDAAAALAGAFAPREGEAFSENQVAAGAVCIAGTGANCFGSDGAGKRGRADGLGPLLGDRGSGYWVGAQGLRAACAAHDGSGPASRVLDATLQHFQVTSVDELVQLVYKPDFKPSRVASLFPIVCECAASKDPVALDILQRAGEELSRTALLVLQLLQVSRVAVTGGVLSRETPVRASFESALRAQIADIEVIEPARDAAVGAALLG